MRHFNWHFEIRYGFRYYKHRHCSVYLLLIAATLCFLSLYCITGDKCDSSVLRKSKYSEMRPVVFTHLRTVSTVGSGSYKSQ